MNRVFEFDNEAIDLDSIYRITRQEGKTEFWFSSGDCKTFHHAWYKTERHDREQKKFANELYEAWKEYKNESN